MLITDTAGRAAGDNSERPRFGGKDDPRTWLMATMIVTALAYGRSLGHQFIADDLLEVVFNRRLNDWSFPARSLANDILWFRDPAHLPQSQYYRPMHDLWLWSNFHLFGLNPAGWHAAAIGMHLLVVWLVFRAGSILADSQWAGLLAATLFALMPVHAEAVVYAAAAPPLIAAAFEMGAFDSYLRFGRARWLSLGLFAGALLSYESAVVFPALIALHALLLESNRSYRTYMPYICGGRRAIRAAWPYALLVVPYFALRFWVLGFVSGSDPLNRHPIAAAQAVLTIPGAMASYAALLVAPWMAGPAHRLSVVGRIAAPGFYIPALGLVILCGAAVLMLRRDPRRRLHLFCIAWILIALLPVLDLRGLFAGSLIQDRYLYLPSFGFCLLAGDLAVGFARGSERKAQAVAIGAGAAAIVCAAFGVSAQGYWRDEVAMFTRCAEENPQAEFCHNRLGVALAARDDYAGARDQFARALALEPDDNLTRYNLALAYERLGDRAAAERTLADRLARLNHPAAKDYAEFAFAAAAAGDESAAAAKLKQAGAMAGGAEIAALARARIALLHKDNQEAERALEKLLTRDPNDEPALEALAEALAADGRYEESLTALRRAAQLAPGEPAFHYKIALMLHNLGRDREARKECAAALAVSPDNPAARALMAAIDQSGAK